MRLLWIVNLPFQVLPGAPSRLSLMHVQLDTVITECGKRFDKCPSFKIK